MLKTPLHQHHIDQGGKMVDFAGWDMPLYYKGEDSAGSIVDEHNQVRTIGGVFDVSHMGRFTFEGKDAVRFLDRVCTRQVAGMQDGQARYSLVCNENGGCKDDVLVYRRAEGQYSMVCNASNRLKLIEHFDAVRGDLVFKFEDITEKTAMIAMTTTRKTNGMVTMMISRFFVPIMPATDDADGAASRNSSGSRSRRPS